MRPITTLLATFLSIVSLAQTTSENVTNINVSKSSKNISTFVLGNTEAGVAGYQLNTDKGSINLGTFDADFNFKSGAEENLNGNTVEKVFVRDSKIVVFISNLQELHNMHAKEKQVVPKVTISVIEMDLVSKQITDSEAILKFDYINNGVFYESQIIIGESANQNFTGVCYGFKRGFGKDRHFFSSIALLDNELKKVNQVDWNGERAKYEVKRYEDILVSNEGEIYVMTASNYSQKMKHIIPLYGGAEINMKTREYEDELPGLTKNSTTRQFSVTNQISVHVVGPNSKEPVVFDIDFETKLRYVSYNGCKMVFDENENLLLAGLFSDAFNNFVSKGIFVLQLMPENKEIKTLYEEYFSEKLASNILTNEQEKNSTVVKIAEGKHPKINKVGIIEFLKNDENDLILVLEYQFYDYKTPVTNFKKNKSFVGNLAVLKFTDGGTKIAWNTSIEKKSFTYNPKGLIGSNRVFSSISSESNTLKILFNERNASQIPKASSSLGVDIDYPKLVMYEISNNGDLGEKKTLIDVNTGQLIMRPEASTVLGNKLVLQGLENEAQQFYLLKW
jgi:hypothetical protein